MANICACIDSSLPHTPPANYKPIEINTHTRAATPSSQVNKNARENNTDNNISGSGNRNAVEGSSTSNWTAGDGNNNLQEPHYDSRIPVDNEHKANSTDPQGNLYIGSSLWAFDSEIIYQKDR